MHYAVTGHRGKIASRLIKLGVEPIKSDILKPKDLRRELRVLKPDVIIHAAGISSVAECEQNYDKAIAVNVHGTADLFGVASEVIGEGRCILLSSDQVFDGIQGRNKEEDEPNPIHNYGWTKWGAEGLAGVYGNKIIRLSRGVDIYEQDIDQYLNCLEKGLKIFVPDFFFRNYAHLDFIATGILHASALFETLPNILHIAGKDNISFYSFMAILAERVGLDSNLVMRREKEVPFAKRPANCGLNIEKADSLGIPLFSVNETIIRMREEWTSKHQS